jgi:GNAT superfamily N-acetyltransferase
MKRLTHKEKWDYHENIINNYYINDEFIGKFTIEIKNDVIKLVGFYVNEKYRGLGYGSLILKDIIKDIEEYNEVFLMIKKDNILPYNMYIKTGFEYYENHDENYIWLVKYNKKLN